MPYRNVAYPRVRTRQTGFTLVELMVAVLLGLLTVLVIAQVLAQSETRRRTISSGADAQLNGALVMYTLQRDIQMAGYGIAANPNALGCKLQAQRGSSATSGFPIALAPIVITQGARGAPDTITLLQGQPRSISVPIQVKENHAKAATAFVVETSHGVSANDFMVAIPEIVSSYATSECSLFQVTHDATDVLTTLSHTRIPHTSSSEWNQSAAHPDAGFAVKSYLINLGRPALKTYAVSANANLTLTDRSWADGSSSTQDLYPQIVNLKALYGKDTNADGVVDTYDATTPSTPAGWQQVLTVRVAVVARSAQAESAAVTSAQPLWDVGANDTISGTSNCHTSSKCLTLKVDHLTNWQRYRYKVYDTIVPLRNVLWHS